MSSILPSAQDSSKLGRIKEILQQKNTESLAQAYQGVENPPEYVQQALADYPGPKETERQEAASEQSSGQNQDSTSIERQEKPRGPAPRSLQARVNKLTAENYEKEAQLAALMQQNESYAQEMARLEQIANQNVKIADVYHQQQLDVKIAKAENDLYEANREGDVDAARQAQKELLDFNADKIKHDIQTQLLPQYSPAQSPYVHSSPYNNAPAQQYVPPPNPDFEDFLDETPWLNPNSYEFDYELATLAAQISQDETRMLKVTGRSHHVDTKPFFNNVKKKLMHAIGAPVPKSQPRTQAPAVQSSPYNTSVTNVSYNPGYVPSDTQESPLTMMEKKWAKGWSRFTNPETGKPYTPAEAEKRFVRAKKELNMQNQTKRNPEW